MTKILGILLWPLALIYGLVILLRNKLYDWNIYKQIGFTPFVVSIGNLAAGGSGKTPMIAYLIERLGVNKTAILSRGYRRKTRGFILANAKHHVTDLGDESFMLHQRFGHKVAVAVGENRSLAIPNIMTDLPETKVILMDDAYQHRSVRPAFNILMSSYVKPFFNDHIIPAGRLREFRSGAQRADVLVISHCPHNMPPADRLNFRQKAGQYLSEKTPISFSTTEYGALCNFDGSTFSGEIKEVIGFSGLAKNHLFESHLNENYKLKQFFSFPDHYDYSKKRIEDILKAGSRETTFICSEKDWVKVKDMIDEAILEEFAFLYQPITLAFLEGEEQFLDLFRRRMEQDQ